VVLVKKFLSLIFLLIISLCVFIPNVNALEVNSEKNIVNMHIFYSNTCPHCKKLKEMVATLDYDNLKVYEYEISDDDVLNIVYSLEDIFNIKIKTVPFTVIGDRYYFGYSNATKHEFENVIKFYSENGYNDIVGNYLIDSSINQKIELPTYPIDSNISIDEYLENQSKKVINIPLIGEVDLASFALPIVAIIIGVIDGFNPCAMWVLLFLISTLIGINNKKRMWYLGLSFILTSSIIYFCFMVAWLNITSFIAHIGWFRMLISLFAICFGGYNLYSYIKTRNSSGCNVVSDKKRNKIFDRIRKFTQEKNFFLALIGIVTLAITVNLVELACSAGLPVLFIEILNMNGVSNIEYYLYIILYVLFFMLDDIIIFVVAVITMELTGFSTKYGKLSKLIGGVLLVLIGLLMALKPEWLMFNF